MSRRADTDLRLRAASLKPIANHTETCDGPSFPRGDRELHVTAGGQS